MRIYSHLLGGKRGNGKEIAKHDVLVNVSKENKFDK